MHGIVALCIAVSALAQAQAPESPIAAPRHGLYVVAHRGAHEGIPENTLAAYRKAIELGCDFVEIDVRTTKDGRFVSVHNDDMESYTGGHTKSLVRDLTFDEIRALDIGSRVGPEWKDEKVPTFEEILDLCRGKIGIYLDLKDAEVAPLVERIRERGMERQVLWYAEPDELREVKRLCGECVIMPDPGPEEGLPKLLEEFKPRVVASVYEYCSEDFVKKCHDAGAIVITDEEDAKDWDTMIGWGLDGIQTDHPEALIAHLEKRRKP